MGKHHVSEQDDGWHFTASEVAAALSIDQVGKVLGVSRSTVGRMSIKGALPYVTMGSGRGHRVYPLRGIDAYIDHRTGGGRHLASSPKRSHGKGLA